MNTPLSSDPELFNLIHEENDRQRNTIELIASENFTSSGVLECLGSILTNKYAEGLPGKRYYGGNEVIDKIENLCIARALKAFNLNPDEWGCNVQPYSGSVANLAVYLGLINTHDRIMGLDLASGGHLTHGFQTAKRRVSGSAVYYESIPYKVNADGFIDYEKMNELACIVNPKIIICGASAYSRDIDYKAFRTTADKCGAILMADIAHISGFVATQELANPFEFCDIVTTTTHKSLRGPRAGIIFFRKKFEDKINNAVFPGLQGGPHENQIAGVAHQLKNVMTDDFKDYIRQVKKNAQTLATYLSEHGYTIVTGGTDNHLFLVDLRNKGVSGSWAETILDYAGITVNKNTVPGDISALNPSGIRIGTPAITTRGFKEADMIVVGEYIDKIIGIANQIKLANAPKTLVDFIQYFSNYSELQEIKHYIHKWMNKFTFYDN